ncbi:uncharacterized protein LOC103177101 [Callorhinchus milii]|uniref:uncharacterized protein LOC103177101 n=1 Tax=Callorhinchus milii TaxID=7868 RepID=UPI001C3FABF7|nr:uncharacterized protein LOC103177101 [Callorhinchus milii]
MLVTQPCLHGTDSQSISGGTERLTRVFVQEDSKSITAWIGVILLCRSLSCRHAVWHVPSSGRFGLARDGARIPNKSWIQNVSCIFYDEIYMNCTWDISESAPQKQQFVLYYKNHKKRFAKCKSQRSGDRGHASCYLQGVTSYYNILYLRINASKNIVFETDIEPLWQDLEGKSFGYLEPCKLKPLRVVWSELNNQWEA